MPDKLANGEYWQCPRCREVLAYENCYGGWYGKPEHERIPRSSILAPAVDALDDDALCDLIDKLIAETHRRGLRKSDLSEFDRLLSNVSQCSFEHGHADASRDSQLAKDWRQEHEKDRAALRSYVSELWTAYNRLAADVVSLRESVASAATAIAEKDQEIAVLKRRATG